MMCMCYPFRLTWCCRASDCITQTNSLNHVKLSSIEIGLCRRETADVWSNSGISMKDIETIYKQTCSSKYHAWKFALGTRIQEVVSVDQCDQGHQIRLEHRLAQALCPQATRVMKVCDDMREMTAYRVGKGDVDYCLVT